LRRINFKIHSKEKTYLILYFIHTWLLVIFNNCPLVGYFFIRWKEKRECPYF